MAKYTKRRHVRRTRKHVIRRVRGTRRGGYFGMGNSGLQHHVSKNKLKKWIFYKRPEQITFEGLQNTRRIEDSYVLYSINAGDQIKDKDSSVQSVATLEFRTTDRE